MALKMLDESIMQSVPNALLSRATLLRALLPALLVASLFCQHPVMAALISVFPGESVQAAINGGTVGDTVVIFDGTYNEDITVNKLIQLAKPQNANVVLAGNLTLSGLSSPYVLHDFTIGIDRTKRVTVQNCSEVILQDLNLTSAAGFTATSTAKLTVLRVDNSGGTGSSVANATKFECKNSIIASYLNISQSNSILRQGYYGTVNSDKGDVFLLGGSVSSFSAGSTVKSGSAGAGDSTAVVFQSTIGGGFSSSVQRSWIGYSNIRNLAISQGTSHVIVGNDFNGGLRDLGNGVGEDAISLGGSTGRVKIMNNVIRNYGTSSNSGSHARGINIASSTGPCMIINNLIQEIRPGGYYNYGWGRVDWMDGGTGIYIAGDRLASNPVTIKGNIFEKLSFGYATKGSLAVWGKFANVTMADNAVHKYNGWISGVDSGAAGVVATNTTELSAPVSWEPSTFFKLPATSTLKNKGPNDARFNNFDGSRNDLGMWGGTQFDPDGRTTTKPVVFGFDITPDQILEGTATQVKLMDIGAVMIEP